MAKHTTKTKTIEIDAAELNGIVKVWAEQEEGPGWIVDHIDYVITEVDGDPMDRFPGRPAVTSIKIIMKPGYPPDLAD